MIHLLLYMQLRPAAIHLSKLWGHPGRHSKTEKHTHEGNRPTREINCYVVVSYPLLSPQMLSTAQKVPSIIVWAT
jgi:hypothetical protein